MCDETARFELHEGLREALGEARGDTLMSLLPTVGWADVATTRDLDAKIDSLGDRLEARMHRDMLHLTWSIIGGFVAIAGVLTANNLL